jgi:hypothetical protein
MVITRHSKSTGVSDETPPCSFGRTDGAQVASQQSPILRLNERIIRNGLSRFQNIPANF